jgi:ribosomal protein S18 acetylase RimI-like enzyme
MNSPEDAAVTIRRANIQDAAMLEALAHEIWIPHYAPIIGIAQVDYMLKQFQSEDAIRHDIESGYVYDIAIINGDACGYSSARNDGDTSFLSKLYVREDCRGRGIARMLFAHAADRARQIGAKHIRLTCNKNNAGSLAAYARLGFAVTDECVTSIGGGFMMDDYILEAKL